MDANGYRSSLSSLTQCLKDWLIPLPTCELCQAQCRGTLPLCDGCWAQLPWIDTGCRSCGEPLILRRRGQQLAPLVATEQIHASGITVTASSTTSVSLPAASTLLSTEPMPLLSTSAALIAASPSTRHSYPASNSHLTLCQRCQQTPFPFSHVIIPLRYGFPVNQWIGALKYQERPGMAHWLAQLLAEHVLRRQHARPTLVSGVPMHPERQRQRGYNQSILLARAVAHQLKLPFTANALLKTRATRHQRTLNAAARRHNLQDAFEITPHLQGKLKDQHIALVDDVVTTGATSAEIANVLLKGGAASVCLWALAKTPMHTPTPLRN